MVRTAVLFFLREEVERYGDFGNLLGRQRLDQCSSYLLEHSALYGFRFRIPDFCADHSNQLILKIPANDVGFSRDAQ